MEILKINVRPACEVEKYEAFRKDLFNCPLCDGTLDFKWSPGPEIHQVIEQACCSACEIKIRTETHVSH